MEIPNFCCRLSYDYAEVLLGIPWVVNAPLDKRCNEAVASGLLWQVGLLWQADLLWQVGLLW
ncbi:hypothetical protein C1Y18_27290 [Pseudomonas sp. MPR-R5A]|uniref:Uncharacterized protein n=1 Tax=Pseudomonas veronii TaxID=76761 RepID=A0A5M8ECB0_PSEVE|nr:hypothetical protein F3K53_28025 [Pseudomonas veronii]PMX06037.1 hypothetical protein C1Y25_27525 [Pseudomonas sp. MPBC4-3]PMX43077.1 hypothetical protein C1Y20_27715 [Pseudomonas sp. FW301-21B01]PMY03124.1 hypothetical protein C1Y18_27290 [Pseudomonas sp. MPR-R5A]PNA62378.1 hypothetical protein C1Y14_27910 [Pseudomonas sp. MPR-R5B]